MGKGQQSNEVMVMAVACADELNCRGFCVEGRPDGHVAIVEHGVAAAGVSRSGDTDRLELTCNAADQVAEALSGGRPARAWEVRVIAKIQLSAEA